MLIGPKERGGSDLKNEERCHLFYLKNVGGPFIFDVKFLGLNNKPAFYTDAFNNWVEV